ncbi:MAG: hypothetical protein OEM38_01245 [Gammaproteobacteria bacterium]|nr:hypothetical protein [Gammaproteobacteria bacterium]
MKGIYERHEHPAENCLTTKVPDNRLLCLEKDVTQIAEMRVAEVN